MTFKNRARIVLCYIFICFLISGCKSNVNKYTISTCKAVKTNIAKCNQLIADDISDKNINTLSAVDEGEL